MQLVPPPTDVRYNSLDELVTAVNIFARRQGYAVRKMSTKKDPAGKQGIIKAYLVCTKSGVIKRRGKTRNTTSNRCNCHWKAAAVHTKIYDAWELKILEGSHSGHEPADPKGLTVHRRADMTPEFMEIIRQRTQQTSTPGQILDSFRDEAENKDKRLLVKARDIYNAKRTIKRRALGGFTPMQALLKMLLGKKNAKKWVFEARKNCYGQLTHLFFANRKVFKLLRKNYEALVVDCTYKTNKFKLPLCTILGHTPMKTMFIVAYAFILHEKEQDYSWVLLQVKLLYNQLRIPNPGLFVTDTEQALANVILIIFPEADHILCLYYIDNNVKAQACRSLCFQAEIDEFMTI